ncbi:MAG: hypothetical protein WBA22_08195 [Candidatus Methanofastidiosia archaeon]
MEKCSPREYWTIQETRGNRKIRIKKQNITVIREQEKYGGASNPSSHRRAEREFLSVTSQFV